MKSVTFTHYYMHHRSRSVTFAEFFDSHHLFTVFLNLEEGAGRVLGSGVVDCLVCLALLKASILRVAQATLLGLHRGIVLRPTFVYMSAPGHSCSHFALERQSPAPYFIVLDAALCCMCLIWEPLRSHTENISLTAFCY